jgi:hypothetical protein
MQQETRSPYFNLLGPWNDDELGALRQNPGERHLPRSRIVLCTDLFEAVDNVEDLWEVLRRVSLEQSAWSTNQINTEILGNRASEIAFLEVVR